MKSIINKLVASSAAAVLLLVGTGMAHADNKGGNRGGSMNSARMGSSQSSQSSGSIKVGQNQTQQINKSGNSISFNKGLGSSTQSVAKQVTGNKVNNVNVAKTNVGSVMNKQMTPASNKSLYCGTPWPTKGSCFPSNWCNWNHGGWNFGCSYGWNSCWSYPWYRTCHYPCYDYCYYPTYDYCCTSPVFCTYQQPVVVTKVVEVIQQPVPVVETVTTTTTTNATAAAVKPPSNDVSFLTNSVVGR